MATRPGDWECPCCGDNQFAWRETCNHCHEGKRPGKVHMKSSASSSRSNDWSCPKCGDLQFGRNESCRQCSASRPKSVGSMNSGGGDWIPIRKGDWICPQCLDHQFVARVLCRRCGTSKPAAADSADEKTCMVCFANVRNAAMVHGDTTHIICCLECAKKFVDKPCPMCRQNVEKSLSAFF